MNLRQVTNILPNLMQKGSARLPLNSSTEIRITRLCTQRCRQCSVYRRTTHPPTMGLGDFRRVTRRLRHYGAYIGFISGGEATLAPHLDKILEEAKRTFILSTTLVTGLVNRPETIRRAGRLALERDIHIQTSLDGLGDLGDDLRGVKNHAKTVLGHMEWFSRNRGQSRSLLYANIVLNDRNLDQVPELIRRVSDLGWKATIGLYHTLTPTTQADDALRLRPGRRLDKLADLLEGHPGILNLDSFIRGIRPFVEGRSPELCAFTDAPVLATRTTIMENGDLHLCWGDPVGNLLRQSMERIFTGELYQSQIREYASCTGCWTTCYTQRLLLIRPRTWHDLTSNFRKVHALRKTRQSPVIRMDI